MEVFHCGTCGLRRSIFRHNIAGEIDGEAKIPFAIDNYQFLQAAFKLMTTPESSRFTVHRMAQAS